MLKAWVTCLPTHPCIYLTILTILHKQGSPAMAFFPPLKPEAKLHFCACTNRCACPSLYYYTELLYMAKS